MVYLRALEDEQYIREEGHQEGFDEAKELYEGVIEEKGKELADKDAELARLRSIIADAGLKA